MERQVAKIFLGGVLRFRICLTSSNPIPRLQPVIKMDLNGHEDRDAPRAAMLIFDVMPQVAQARTLALLHNIRNIRICMGKKPNVSVTYENERISITNSFPYTKCVLHLLCGPWADLWVSYH